MPNDSNQTPPGVVLRQFVDLLGDGYWEWRPESNTTYLSPSARTMLGYGDEELSGSYESFLEIVHPDDRALAQEILIRRLQGDHGHTSTELRLQRKDGSYCWVSARARVLERDAEGRPICLASVTTDITTRKEAEFRVAKLTERIRSHSEELEQANALLTAELARREAVERRLTESEARLRSYLQASESGAWEWNPAQHTIYLSPEWRQLLDYGEEEFDGTVEGIVALIHPDDLESVRTYSEQFALERRDVYECEYRLRKKSGEYVPVLSKGSVLSRGPDGEATLVCGIIADVSPLKQFESRLREAEERWHFALAGGGQGAWDWNLETDRAVYSDGWFRILGFEPDELEAQTLDQWRAMVHPEDFEPAWMAQQAHMRGETPTYEAEFRMRHKSGRWIWILSRGQVTKRSAEGAPLRIVGTHTDISVRKQHEEEIDLLNLQLTDRTARLEAANQELEAFSYSVSHDLRSPLRSIDGFSAALEEDFGDQLPTEARDSLQRIRRAVRRMGDLIDDLLLLSRVTRHEMVRQETDFSQIVQGIVQDKKDQYRGRTIEFSIRPGVRAFADPKLMQIVFENLLDNAIKFTAQRKDAKIEFDTVGEGPEVEYVVRDNGIGFDPADRDHLFKPFFRLHGGESFEGHGIGLATVIRVVQRHGGQVSATGEKGRGATFGFTLG